MRCEKDHQNLRSGGSHNNRGYGASAPSKKDEVLLRDTKRVKTRIINILKKEFSTKKETSKNLRSSPASSLTGF